MVKISTLTWIAENNADKAVAFRHCLLCDGLIKTVNKHSSSCRLTHIECQSIMNLFRHGKMRSYWQRLSACGFINEYGFPIGRFPRLYASKLTYQRKILMAKRRGLING